MQSRHGSSFKTKVSENKGLFIGILLISAITGTIIITTVTWPETETRVNEIDNLYAFLDIKDKIDVSKLYRLPVELNDGSQVSFAFYAITDEQFAAEKLGHESLFLSNGTAKVFYNDYSGFYFIFGIEDTDGITFYMNYNTMPSNAYTLETLLNDILEVAA